MKRTHLTLFLIHFFCKKKKFFIQTYYNIVNASRVKTTLTNTESFKFRYDKYFFYRDIDEEIKIAEIQGRIDPSGYLEFSR